MFWVRQSCNRESQSRGQMELCDYQWLRHDAKACEGRIEIESRHQARRASQKNESLDFDVAGILL